MPVRAEHKGIEKTTEVVQGSANDVPGVVAARIAAANSHAVRTIRVKTNVLRFANGAAGNSAAPRATALPAARVTSDRSNAPSERGFITYV